MDEHLRQLFGDGGRDRVLSVPLPAGSFVWPDTGYTRLPSAKRPAFWLSDEPADSLTWAALRAEHPRSGLWPVLLDETAQPWSAGQIMPDEARLIGEFSAAGFMAEVWEEWVARVPMDALTEVEPFGVLCPGPAEPGELQADPDEVADWYAGLVASRGTPLGLAAVSRGADALAVMGWQGALHHNEWMVPMAAVVRSWEDRFGARVVGMGFNTLDLSVAAPPVDHDHAVHVAAEHWAFCPDNIVQGAGDLTGYAEQILGRHAWSFWWD
jgi:hypothetical protein